MNLATSQTLTVTIPCLMSHAIQAQTFNYNVALNAEAHQTLSWALQRAKEHFGSHASSERGAILGHLKIFGGTDESLERGSLPRGRFVIRLLGEFIRLQRASSPNPPSG
ncbi:uncharacterized protein HD556DRAFT_1312032 [Suillus plorans]|uniref:Uncharacterized protein n=1 Tax=Suillus plorans TaxID=116603 RepID=A0A9P7AHI2_9AGAM|nr:uncharacterized protein HD556DRAFT_1312032 [Suillus plorans]KAG1788441.1 hypothetical protein HD556DRAFT_1312032 [Suillus plorans]